MTVEEDRAAAYLASRRAMVAARDARQSLLQGDPIAAAQVRVGWAPLLPPWSQATAFVVGLPVGAAMIALLVRRPEMIVTDSVPLLIAAGLLVGFGTRLGNGCTSGHGVCGIGRLSPRSIAATATFMATAATTVFILRHVIGG